MTVDTSLDHLHAIEVPTPFAVGPITLYVGDAADEPLTLIDTGPRTKRAQLALEAGLGRLGYNPGDLERIVVSHAHVDHFGLASELVDLSGAQVLSHRWNERTLGDYNADRERRTTFYGALLRQASVPDDIMAAVGRATRGIRVYARPVGVEVALDEGDTLRLAHRDWQVLHTPGHAGGLVCLYESQSRTLLSSDHLLADISSNPVVEPPPPGETERLRSLALYRASLQRVATLGAARALPSHGPVIRDVTGLVDRRLAFHERRAGRVLATLRDGARTTWDVVQVLFPNRSPMDIFLAVSEIIGHLDLLETEGRIAGRDAGGITYWELTEGN
jgi:glyoxylase-like metal-dependent hydrolase (beta-lactamase superfamily II)